MQTTSHILMIRPVNFRFNEETAVNNAFQAPGPSYGIQETAALEFGGLVDRLRSEGMDITVIDDSPLPSTPDSIFPNNWISFHEDGTIFLYPMYAHNRRMERKPEVLERIRKRFQVSREIDLSFFENRDLYLEGTGSMVLDRPNRMAFASLSARTDEEVLAAFCQNAGYRSVVFQAKDEKGQAIYHTNVMMCVADRYTVACMDSVSDTGQRNRLASVIRDSGKDLVPITMEQMNHFAGNMLQVENNQGEKLLVMSTQAYESLSQEQKNKLESYNRIVHAPLQTIETSGGGSARCMMAEIHLPEILPNPHADG
jgi:hypothetical protein